MSEDNQENQEGRETQEKLIFIPIESKTATEVAYDGEDKLQIRYANGGLYEYSEVTPETYDGLISAESKGKYINKVIKKLPTVDLNEKKTEEIKPEEIKPETVSEVHTVGAFNSSDDEQPKESSEVSTEELSNESPAAGAFNSDDSSAEKSESFSIEKAQEELNKIGSEAFFNESQGKISQAEAEDIYYAEQEKIAELATAKFNEAEEKAALRKAVKPVEVEKTEDGFAKMPDADTVLPLDKLNEKAEKITAFFATNGTISEDLKFQIGLCEREPQCREAYRVTIHPDGKTTKELVAVE